MPGIRTTQPLRARDERGFGMVELLAAMTVMLVGLLALFALFESGLAQIRRASTVTTAAAIADAQMERFRAVRYETLGLDPGETCPSGCAAADATYRGDAAYSDDSAPSATLSTSLSASTTAFSITAPGFPPAAEFRVSIGTEVMLVTAVAEDGGTTTWTVTRGVDGTAAAAHSAGAAVTLERRVDVRSCSSSPSPCTSLVPTAPVTGADGRSYRVDVYATWARVTTADDVPGRAVKKMTVVVRDAAPPHKEWARVASTFDESTGL